MDTTGVPFFIADSCEAIGSLHLSKGDLARAFPGQHDNVSRAEGFAKRPELAGAVSSSGCIFLGICSDKRFLKCVPVLEVGQVRNVVESNNRQIGFERSLFVLSIFTCPY